jgi:hypothetical protein
MNQKWCKFAAAAVAAVALGVSTSGVEAGSLTFGGWRASWDSAYDDASGTHVTLTVLATTDDTVLLQKVAVFTDGPDEFGMIAPIEINFEQISADAVSNIIIDRLIVTNDTGVPWGGFREIIENGNTGTDADVHFNITDTFGPPYPLDASPFDVVNIIQNNEGAGVPQEIVFGDGVLPYDDGGAGDDHIWRVGFVDPEGGSIYINAAPSETGSKRFVLKEQPLPIPLPAAAWMGLSGLMGLGVVGSLKNLRRKNAK